MKGRERKRMRMKGIRYELVVLGGALLLEVADEGVGSDGIEEVVLADTHSHADADAVAVAELEGGVVVGVEVLLAHVPHEQRQVVLDVLHLNFALPSELASLWR
jgi:hypothetical protein